MEGVEVVLEVNWEQLPQEVVGGGRLKGKWDEARGWYASR